MQKPFISVSDRKSSFFVSSLQNWRCLSFTTSCTRWSEPRPAWSASAERVCVLCVLYVLVEFVCVWHFYLKWVNKLRSNLSLSAVFSPCGKQSVSTTTPGWDQREHFDTSIRNQTCSIEFRPAVSYWCNKLLLKQTRISCNNRLNAGEMSSSQRRACSKGHTGMRTSLEAHVSGSSVQAPFQPSAPKPLQTSVIIICWLFLSSLSARRQEVAFILKGFPAYFISLYSICSASFTYWLYFLTLESCDTRLSQKQPKPH